MSEAGVSRAGGDRFELFGNEPRVLGGTSELLKIERGSLALYSAEVRDGVQVGPRRFLQRIGSGQAVVSVPGEPFERLGLIVVPVREAHLRRVPLREVWGDPKARAAAEAESLLEGWIRLLASLLAPSPAPRPAVRLEPGREVPLEKGQAALAAHERVVWCRVLEGRARLLDLEEAVLAPGDAPVPLVGEFWLRAAANGLPGGDPSSLRIRGQATGELEASDVEGGLRGLTGQLFRHLRQEIERETEAERKRLRERRRTQERRTRAALEELAAVFEAREPAEHGGPPLLAAISAIGRRLGVEVRSPGRSERAGGRADPVEAIARASRLRHRRVRLAGRWWTRDAGPLLAWLEEDRRPLALLPDRRLRYRVFDPRTGTREPLTPRLAASLAPEAVTFYRPLPEGRLGLWDLLRFTLGPRRRDLGWIVAAGVAATLLGMLVPQGTAVMMDFAIPDADVRLLLEIGAGLLCAALGATVFRLSQGIVLARLGLATEAEGQAAVWDRLLRLRPSFFRGFSSGDLQSRVMAVSSIGRALSGVTLTTLFSGFLALLNLGLLFYYSPSLALVAVLVGLVVMAFTIGVGSVVRRNLRTLLELEGRFFGLVIQLIHAVGKLRVAGAEDRAFTHWIRNYGPQVRLRSNIQKWNDAVGVFHQVLPTASSILLFLFAYDALLASRVPGHGGGFSLGQFLAFNVAYGAFLGGVLSLSRTAVSIQDLMVQARRVAPILEAEPEIDEAKQDPGELEGRVTMDGVVFSYDPEGPRILDGVTLEAEPGEFVAIVGPSGSGKSTIFRLLLGFERPDEGMVAYDGQDLATLDVLAVRRQLGVVLQGGRLDAGSIFENIACGNIITLDEAWAAAEDAGFADDVRAMPMGMHTIVSVGGGNLSGGQRQRLLIARALAHRPRILLFDEATSALDNHTQAVVSESLDRLQVTRLVVAHRLSTIRQADRIYVIEGGRVVQRGRFDELMAQEGDLFARMMERQMA